MKLYSRSVERSLRRAIRREVKASPALRAERKRLRRQFRSPIFRYIQFLFLGLMMGGGLLAQFVDKPSHGILEYGLLIQAVALTGIVMLMVPRLMGYLFYSVELMALRTLPISAADYFHRQFQRTCRWAVWIGAYLACFFCAALLQYPHPIQRFVFGVGLAVIESVWCLSLVWLGARYARKNLQPLGVFLIIVAVGLVVLRDLVRPWIDQYASGLIWLAPAGWGIGVFKYGLLDGQLLPWLMLLPMLGVAALLWPVVRQCAEKYRLPEMFNLAAPEFEPERLNTLAAVDRAESTARTALGETSWQSESMPLIERTVWRWLTERERAVAQFLMADSLPAWSQWWLKALGVTAIAFLIAILLNGDSRVMVLVFGILITAGMSAPLLGGQWHGLTPTHSGFGFVPLYAFYPISYRDLLRTILKINLVRCLMWLPLLILGGAMLAWSMQASLRNNGTDILLTAVKIVIIVAAWQPALFMFKISRGTNDSELPLLRSLLPIGCIFGGVILTILLAIGALASSWITTLICLPLVIVFPLLFLWIYVWCLRRMRIDVSRKSL